MPSIDSIKASDGTGAASVATVQSVRAPAATTLIVDTVQGINGKFHATMGTPHTFVDPVTSETITVISEATAVDFQGHVDGTNLEIDVIAPGYTDNGSAVNDIVIIKPTTQWADEVADVLEVSHDDDGTLKDNIVTTAKIADSAVTSEKLSSTISFRAYNSTASYSFSNTPTVVNFATEVYDTGSDYDGTNKFTAPVDGIYNFSARASREDNTLGYLAIYIYVNGSAYAKGNHVPATINGTGVLVSTDVKLSASDYVQAYLQANGSASGNLGTTNALCYFAGHLVGRT